MAVRKHGRLSMARVSPRARFLLPCPPQTPREGSPLVGCPLMAPVGMLSGAEASVMSQPSDEPPHGSGLWAATVVKAWALG